VLKDGNCTLYGVQQLRTTAADGASTDRAFAHIIRCLYITLYGVQQLRSTAAGGASTGRVFTEGACTVYVVKELRTTAADGASTGRVFAHNRRCLCSKLYGVHQLRTSAAYGASMQVVCTQHTVSALYIVRCTAVTYYCSRWC
jgi:hypothetical protein